MNNRFPYNARQNRPPGQHPQRPHFNHNQQQPNQQQHLHMHQQQLLNPRAPQFHPHPTQQPPPHIPPAFNHNNNTGTWNAQPPPGFHHHQPPNTPSPSNAPPHHHQNWNPNNANPPSPQIMSESRNFQHQQQPRFYAQNTPPARPSFLPPPRFTPPNFMDENHPRLPLPPSNTFQFGNSNNNNQFRPGFVSRPQSPSFLPPQRQRDHIMDEKEMYKEKMKDTVSSWLQGKKFEQMKKDCKENLLKVLF